MTSPPPQRVSRLIPFVHVTDVERSIAWYGHLGFAVTEIELRAVNTGSPMPAKLPD